jgi:hypothetical protein
LLRVPFYQGLGVAWLADVWQGIVDDPRVNITGSVFEYLV